MKTLVISKNEIRELLDLPELIQGIKEAYIKYSADKTVQAKRAVAKVEDSSIVINFPGYLDGYDAYTIKVNVKTSSNFNKGLPFLIGSIMLIDCKTGQLKALLESSLITAMRTGAAGAIGAEILALPNAGKIGLIGAGVQGEWQLRALHAIGRLKEAYIYDIVAEKAEKLAEFLSKELNIIIHTCETLQQTVSLSEILVVTTQSREPIITSEMLHPGLHINAFGADQPGKVELSHEVINSSVVVVDDNCLAISDGSLNVAFSRKKLSQDIAYSEIGEILVGKSIGRRMPQEVTIFANVGLAIQDIVACSIVYNKAIELKKGKWIDLNHSIDETRNLTSLQMQLEQTKKALQAEQEKRIALEKKLGN